MISILQDISDSYLLLKFKRFLKIVFYVITFLIKLIYTENALLILLLILIQKSYWHRQCVQTLRKVAQDTVLSLARGYLALTSEH